MNKYPYCTYLMSKLINIYTLFLAIYFFIYPIFSHFSVFTLLFIKLFSHLTGIIEGYSLWINSYTDNCGIYMKCYIAMARFKRECIYSGMKGIVRDFSMLRGHLFRKVQCKSEMLPLLCESLPRYKSSR